MEDLQTWNGQLYLQEDIKILLHFLGIREVNQNLRGNQTVVNDEIRQLGRAHIDMEHHFFIKLETLAEEVFLLFRELGMTTSQRDQTSKSFGS